MLKWNLFKKKINSKNYAQTDDTKYTDQRYTKYFRDVQQLSTILCLIM